MHIIRIDETQGHLVYTLFDSYRVFYKQASSLTVAQQFIDERLQNKESVIFVALETATNKPIGFTQLYPKYSSARVIKNWILNDLYVDAAYRKQGIGEKLIYTALQFAKDEGAKVVELSTAVDNYTAQSLYEEIGFKRKNPIQNFTIIQSAFDIYHYAVPVIS